MKDVTEYIKQFPPEIQDILNRFRGLIKEESPESIEAFSYQMPTFKLKGKNLVHFAAWESHIGFYPTPSAVEKFKSQLSKYKFAKGSIQFPIAKPIPWELIQKIVKFRVSEIEGLK